MNININYNIDDYKSDLFKTAEIKIRLLYEISLSVYTFYSLVVLVFFAIGIKCEETGHYISGIILVVIGSFLVFG